MIPPSSKAMITEEAERHVHTLKLFKSSLPVIMIGELKLDRIDHKVSREAIKLNNREMKKGTKLERNKKYEKRKAAITYRSYTVDFKKRLIRTIKELDQTTDDGLNKIIRAKGKELNIHPKNIFRWYNTKEIKKKEGGRKALFPEMEDRLAQFVVENPKTKRKQILRQAKKIMEDLNIPGREYFNFSKGWYERFRDRLIRKKIIPGKLSNTKYNHEDSYSESDCSESSIVKKQEKLEFIEESEVKRGQKLEKIENFSSEEEFSDDSESESFADEDAVKEEYVPECNDQIEKQSITKITSTRGARVRYSDFFDSQCKNDASLNMSDRKTDPNLSGGSQEAGIDISGNDGNASIWNEEDD